MMILSEFKQYVRVYIYNRANKPKSVWRICPSKRNRTARECVATISNARPQPSTEVVIVVVVVTVVETVIVVVTLAVVAVAVGA